MFTVYATMFVKLPKDYYINTIVPRVLWLFLSVINIIVAWGRMSLHFFPFLSLPCRNRHTSNDNYYYPQLVYPYLPRLSQAGMSHMVTKDFTLQQVDPLVFVMCG